MVRWSPCQFHSEIPSMKREWKWHHLKLMLREQWISPFDIFCDLFVVRNVTLEFLLIITDIQSEIFPLQERRIDVWRSSRVNNFSSHFIYSQVISISSLTGRRLKSMISPKILMLGIWGGEKDHDRNEHFCWIDFQWQLHPLRYWTERPAVAFEMFFWALLDGVECVMTRRNLLNHCIAMTIIRGWNLSIPLQLLSGVVEWTTQKPDENFGGGGVLSKHEMLFTLGGVSPLLLIDVSIFLSFTAFGRTGVCANLVTYFWTK